MNDDTLEEAVKATNEEEHATYQSYVKALLRRLLNVDAAPKAAPEPKKEEKK